MQRKTIYEFAGIIGINVAAITIPPLLNYVKELENAGYGSQANMISATYFSVLALCFVILIMVAIYDYFHTFEKAMRYPHIDASIMSPGGLLKEVLAVEHFKRVDEFAGNSYVVEFDKPFAIPITAAIDPNQDVIETKKAIIMTEKPWEDEFETFNGRVDEAGFSHVTRGMMEGQFSVTGVLPGNIPVLMKIPAPRRLTAFDVARDLLGLGIQPNMRVTVEPAMNQDDIDVLFQDEPPVMPSAGSSRMPTSMPSIMYGAGGIMPAAKAETADEKSNREIEMTLKTVVDIVDNMFKGWDDAAKKGKTDPSAKP